MKQVTSRHNVMVARYRDAARGGAEVMLLDGVHLVQDALAARLQIRHAMLAREDLARGDLRDLVGQLEGHGVEIAQASPAVMAAVSPVRSVSPVVAMANRPSHAPDVAYAVDLPFVVIASDIQDAGNLGATIRVAEAGGASGLVAAGQCADPFGWKALRGSMGSALRLPVTRQPSPHDAVDLARRHGCRIVAAVPRRGRSLFDTNLEGPLAVLVGGEGGGLPEGLVTTAEHQVTIPMERPVESLNAAVAAAIMVYEVRRQRTYGFALPR